MSMLRLLGLLLLMAAMPFQAQAQEMHSRATLVSESTAPAPGKPVTLAVRMAPDPGWHTYWENPGDAGFGMTIEWKLPAGVTVGPLRYPVPETLLIRGLMNHVYEHEHALLVDLAIAPSIAKGTPLPVTGEASWLACSDSICLPQKGTVSINLTAGDGAPDAGQAERIMQWRAALPQPMDQAARYAINGNRIDIAIPFARGAALDHPWFFAATTDLFAYATPQSARRTGDWLVISGSVTKPFDTQIVGLLRIGKDRGLLVHALPGTMPSGGESVPVLGAATEKTMPLPALLATLAAAILGGLLLNLMPCVFPILGLKALSLAKAGGDERTARRDALGYSAGVIASCVALGAVMMALRAGGEQVGWAFQLQEPRVVLALFLLMIAITANLAGLFELPSFSMRSGVAKEGSFVGSFGTGVLTAIVATPCTGPFMAAALGAALLLPPLPALLLFAGLGFGLALPFLAIAYIPALRRVMPKSGAWLGRFRLWMAVPMALTSLALLWLLWRLSGSFGLTIGVATLLPIVVLLWWIGKRQAKAAGAGVFALLALILAAVAIVALPREPVKIGAEHDLLKSEPFSEVRLAKLREAGKPVFVYFTADWCVTCKVNEAAAIHRQSTVDAFTSKGIVTLKGDFTRPDPAISNFLAQHGRSGVPLYLFYAKGKEASVLPQLLTPAMLENLQP